MESTVVVYIGRLPESISRCQFLSASLLAIILITAQSLLVAY